MVKKVEYSRSMNQSNLIITAGEENEIEKDCIEMFRYNKIPYFLQFNTQKKDHAIQFYYDITGMQPLEQALEYQTLNYKFVKKLLNSFDQACIQAANYMLTENDIVLLPELLYLNIESDEVMYCYLPGNQIQICVQFKRFMEYIMRHLDHKDKKAVQLVYGVYQQVAEEKSALHTVLKNAENEWKQIVCSDGQMSTSSEKDVSMLSDLEQTEFPVQQPRNYIQADTIVNKKKSYVQADTIINKKKNYAQADVIINKKKLFEKNVSGKGRKKEAEKKQAAKKITNFFRKKIYTDSYQKMEDETIFEEEPEELLEKDMVPYAVPDTNVIQNKFIYQGIDRDRDFICLQGKKILGSSAKYADICIPLPIVSKVHARIEVNEKGTFLEDMNSANGTQVNGETLRYREKRLLQKGDTISIAGESYNFC